MSSSDPNPPTSKDPTRRPESRPGSSSSTDPPPSLDLLTTSLGQTTSLGGLSATTRERDDDDSDNDNDNDGFKTPTGSSQRVPEARPCPPVPRKPTALPIIRRPIKRKSSADDATWMNRGRRISSLLLDLTEEVESMFPPGLGCKIKKARTV